MSWRTLVEQAYGGGREDARPRFEPPAYAAALERVERGLSCRLPQDLRDLLLEADGIMELSNFDGSWSENMWLVWPLAEVRERNLELRRERGEGRFPPGALAFSSAGADGIVFAFDLKTDGAAVFAWDPLEAQLARKAPSLREFISGWIAGKISV
jgi:hypothetical protein